MRRVIHLAGTFFREAGGQLDRIGLKLAEKDSVFLEPYSRHRPIMNLYRKQPYVAFGVFVAPNAAVIGNVALKNSVSVWYGAVIRGDEAPVSVGGRSNIQDRAVITTLPGKPTNIGEGVVIGHGALITASIIGDRVMIGQGAIIGEGSIISPESIVAAGAVVLPGTMIKPRELYAGNPAAYVRDVVEAELEMIEKNATSYEYLAEQHSAEFLPKGTVYKDAEAKGLAPGL